MTKVAFCFPGQGSLEVGMGREIAEAVPEAMEIYRIGSEVTGMDLAHLCFEAPLEELVETEVQQPTLVATSLAILAAVRKAGLEPDVVVGHSVGEFAALASVGAMSEGEAIGLVRERGLAMAEAARERPGAMAAILGLEDHLVETLCRKIRLKVSGAFHSPLVGQAGRALKPAIDRIRFTDPVKPFMSTVTAKIEPAQRLGALLVDQLTAPVRFTQAAGELMRGGVTTFVEIGPGSVLSGLVKRIDRGARTFSVNDLASLEKVKEALGTS